MVNCIFAVLGIGCRVEVKIDGGGKRGVTDNGSGVLNDREGTRYEVRYGVLNDREGTGYATRFSMIERRVMMGDGQRR